MLRVVQLGEQGEQELVQDLRLAVTETQEVVREVKFKEGGAIAENHVEGFKRGVGQLVVGKLEGCQLLVLGKWGD